jgi:hypothetical protein
MQNNQETKEEGMSKLQGFPKCNIQSSLIAPERSFKRSYIFSKYLTWTRKVSGTANNHNLYP